MIEQSLLSNLSAIWKYTKGSRKVRIAIIDTDVDLDHIAFKESRDRIQKLSIDGIMPSGNVGHGTYVTSLIFGDTENAIAPDCSGLIIPVYEDTDQGLGTTQENLAKAIDLAVKHQADVINISGGVLTNDFSSIELQESVARCTEKGIQVVAAVGNDGCDCLHVPASLPGVLAAGVSNESNEPFSFNNYGSAYQKQGLLTPLDGFKGAITGAGYASKIASSYAAPVLSGIVALLYSLKLDTSQAIAPSDVAKAMISESDKCPKDSVEACKPFLAGILNLAKTMEALDNMLLKTSGIEPQQFEELNIDIEPKNNLNMDNEIISQELPEQLQNSEIHNVQEKVTERIIEGPVAYAKPSDCSCSSEPSSSLVYLVGTLGFSFPSRARRIYFDQVLQKSAADNTEDLLKYLQKNPYECENLIWTFNFEDYPKYAIRPTGPFANTVYDKLCGLVSDQFKQKAVRVSLPGNLKSNEVQTEYGQKLKVLEPAIQGVKGWEIPDAGKKGADKALSEKIANFINRVVYDLRNGGVQPGDRAMNFALTESIKIESAFVLAHNENLELSKIAVVKSPVSRPDSESYDVKLTFFSPTKRLETSNRVFMLTVDVSDVVPLLVGDIKTWSEA